MFFVIAATPALAADGEPAIDINDFLPSDIGDWNGDGVPDQFDDKNGDGLPDIPDGIHGIWDDTVGAKTAAEFVLEVDIFRQTFDFDDEESMLVGPCGGLAISYDSAGNSIDAVVDATKKHPIRAALYGFVAGLGVAVLLTFAYPVIALESISQVITQWVIVVVAVMILSALWGTFGPAKKPKGPPPASVMAVAPAAGEMTPGAADTGDEAGSGAM